MRTPAADHALRLGAILIRTADLITTARFAVLVHGSRLSVLHVECNQRVVLCAHGVQRVEDLADISTIGELSINGIGLVLVDIDEVADEWARLQQGNRVSATFDGDNVED